MVADKKETPRYINEVLSEVGLTLAEIAGRYPTSFPAASAARRHRARLDHQALADRRRRAGVHA